MHQDLAQNLRLLCSYYKSIAEVCRRLGINRPQFNRYLSGQHRPSANTLRRLCEFFGVDEREILLPHGQFQRIVDVRPTVGANPEPMTHAIQAHLDRLDKETRSDVDAYLGYYYEYYQSMSAPGKVLQNLVCLERRDNRVVYQRTERMQATANEPPCHNRYQGVAYLLTDRLFLVDYETLNRHEITQTILFPSFRNRITRLTGLKIGVSDNSERMPCCARVLYEYLGQNVSVRKALAHCGLHDLDTDRIDPAIREAVHNDMTQGEYLFRARH